MNTEGLYVFTLYVTDTQGRTYQDSVAINVVSLTAIDTLLRSKWEGMKAALNDGDIEAAMNYIVSRSQEMYRQNFTIMNSILPQIASDLGTIQFVRTEDNGAVYEMTLSQGGQVSSFYVLFVIDVDGIWKIRFF
jgi:hypothetical protein